MERLTEWDQDGNGVCGSQYRCESSCHECSHHDKMIDRLAAYEDTGLEPEEVAELAQAKRPGRFRGGTVVVNRKDYTIRDYMSPGRLVAWAEWIPHKKEVDYGTVSGN